MNSWYGGTPSTDLSSWQNSFGTNLSPSVTSPAASPGFNMDPFTGALVGGAFNLVGGMFGNAAASNTAQQSFEAQRDAYKVARENANKAFYLGKWGPLFAATTGADLALNREKEAREWLQGSYAERQFGLQSEATERAQAAEISPARQKAMKFENLLNIQRETARQALPGTLMFGRTSLTAPLTFG